MVYLDYELTIIKIYKMLEELPNELLERIASNLSAIDIINVSLLNKIIRAKIIENMKYNKMINCRIKEITNKLEKYEGHITKNVETVLFIISENTNNPTQIDFFKFNISKCGLKRLLTYDGKIVHFQLPYLDNFTLIKNDNDNNHIPFYEITLIP